MGRNADDIIGGHGAAAALHILISSFPPLGFSSRRPPARCRWTAKSWRHKVGPRSSAALRRQSRRGIGGGVDGALRARRKGARWMIGLPARCMPSGFWQAGMVECQALQEWTQSSERTKTISSRALARSKNGVVI